MRQGRFNCIALLNSTTGTHSYLPPELLSGFHRALARRDQHLTVAQLPDESLTSEAHTPKILRTLMADGFLVNYHFRVPSQMQTLIRRHNIPSVWINHKQPRDSAYLDDLGAARRLTQHLLEIGHRRIAYVDCVHNLDDPTEHYSAFDRRGGYVKAMEEAGRTPRLIHAAGKAPREDRLGAVAEWLKTPDRPTAVLTYSNSDVLPIEYTAAWLGLRVPRDLSVATFSDPRADDVGLKPTRMLNAWAELGEAAVELLQEKLAAPRRTFRSLVIPFSFDPGQTCAPPGERS
jgi:LacI family transcriptional regulator